jgi:uncharacterized membrane protein
MQNKRSFLRRSFLRFKIYLESIGVLSYPVLVRTLARARLYFISGLIFLLPSAVTLYLLWYIFSILDNVTGSFFKEYYDIYIPGLGIMTTLLVVMVSGMLAANYAGKKTLAILEMMLLKLPFANTIMGAVKQVISLIAKKEHKAFSKVVIVPVGTKGTYLLGFLVGGSMSAAEESVGTPLVTVFVPHAPTPVTGFVVMIERELVREISMSVEDAFKFLVSVGFLVPDSKLPPLLQKEEATADLRGASPDKGSSCSSGASDETDIQNGR